MLIRRRDSMGEREGEYASVISSQRRHSHINTSCYIWIQEGFSSIKLTGTLGENKII